MNKIYLEKELKSLGNKIYKALNVYEEENGIEPDSSKKKKKITEEENKHLLSFSDYIDFVIRKIEGIQLSLDESEDNQSLIEKLSYINHNLHSMQYSKGKVDYLGIKRSLFKNCDIIKEYVGNFKVV